MAKSCTWSCFRVRGLLAICLVIVVPASLKVRDLLKPRDQIPVVKVDRVAPLTGSHVVSTDRPGAVR